MKCPSCGIHAKGSICDYCDSIIFVEPEKVKKVKIKKPIKKASKKMGSDLREYGKLRKQFLLENPDCCVYPEEKATEVHHAAGRGMYLLDITTWRPVSRRGHIKIELEPEWAKEHGFSLERLKTTI
jgi:hypothetical protein